MSNKLINVVNFTFNHSPFDEIKSIHGVETPFYKPYYASKSWKGRVFCLLNLACHTLSIIGKPIMYIVAAIVQLVVIAPIILLTVKNKKLKIEAIVQVFKFIGCAFVSPFIQAGLAARSLAGTILPGAYYCEAPHYMKPLIQANKQFYSQVHLSRIEHESLNNFFGKIADPNSGNARSHPEYNRLIEGHLKELALEFQAVNPNGLARIDNDKKLMVLIAIADAAQECKPRWYEEVYAQARAIHEPEKKEKRLDHYIECVLEDFLRIFANGMQVEGPKNRWGFVTVRAIGGSHINDANVFRQLFGNELGIDISHAHLDMYAQPQWGHKDQYLKDFLKYVCNEDLLIQNVKARINSDYNKPLRSYYLDKLANEQKIIEAEIMEKYTIKGYTADNYDLLLNDSGISLLLQPKLNQLNELREKMGISEKGKNVVEVAEVDFCK